MKITPLETQWTQLMALCESETRFRGEGGHDRLLKHLASEIEQLAGQMGFSARRIASRDFRAHRDGDRIIGLITD